jgi:hypothetical protein
VRIQELAADGNSFVDGDFDIFGDVPVVLGANSNE